jgi:putative ABC transport system permease protein
VSVTTSMTRPMVLACKMLARHRIRLILTVLGIAIASFLFAAEQAVRDGVHEATAAHAAETRLIVYRANRFCPFTSRVPESYTDDIARIDGVASVAPMQIAVSNCRASLDVVVFRGVRAVDAERILAKRLHFVEGSLAQFLARGDGALVGRALASRRGFRVGDRFSSAGITVTVAGIVDANGPQDRNACYVQLPFLQAALGGQIGGEVTQFEVEVQDPAQLERVATAIDARFATDRAPTSTRSERAFAARAAEDIVAISRFAGLLAFGALAAIFALVANAIVLSLEGRNREFAILQSIGFRTHSIFCMILAEAACMAVVGALIGAGLAQIVLSLGNFGIGAEGVLLEFRPSFVGLSTSLLASLVVGIAAGFLPALAASRRGIAEQTRLA